MSAKRDNENAQRADHDAQVDAADRANRVGIDEWQQDQKDNQTQLTAEDNCEQTKHEEENVKHDVNQILVEVIVEEILIVVNKIFVLIEQLVDGGDVIDEPELRNERFSEYNYQHAIYQLN